MNNEGMVHSGNYAGQGAQRAQPSSPKPVESVNLVNALLERAARMNSIVERIERIADMTTGPIPAEPSGRSGGNAAMPQHLSAKLDVVIEGFDLLQARATAALERIERFV